MNTIFARRSIREYTAEVISKKDIKAMLEAAMAAPSASNRKPWHFIVLTNRKILDDLAMVHPHGKMLFKAPLCIAVCGDTTISARYWVQDCSAATENLLLAAAALGLGAVWLGVHPREERIGPIRKVLNIPETVVPLNLISIGRPAEEKEPRTQYDEQRVHRQQW
ncbi:MAG: nitroreductase family protein [Candidatus Bathyarchaeota archaeon]|nr:MAG: nitroreductase family protein [Candidatus Bathyarchaeota archaeon]